MLLNFEIQGYYQRRISFLFPLFFLQLSSVCITLASQCDLGLLSIFTLKEDLNTLDHFYLCRLFFLLESIFGFFGFLVLFFFTDVFCYQHHL